MRIAKIYTVTFRGKVKSLGTPAMVNYWVVDDNGVRQEVKITNHPKLREAFEWMSEADCLRHLQYLGNSYFTNTQEVEAAEYQNAMMEENAYTLGHTMVYIDPMTGVQRTKINGLVPVPEHTFEASWSFWSREHAVMFKLAMGGDLED